MEKSPELAAAIISSVSAIISIVLTLLAKRHFDRANAMATERDKLDLYRHPLLLAATSLYWRLQNILYMELATIYLFSERTSEARRLYVIQHTAYVFASLWCWLRIMKDQALFKQVAERDYDSGLLWDYIEAVREGFSSDSPQLDDNDFMIWRGTLDAIGEEMIILDTKNGMSRCMGYSTFCLRMKEKPFLKELVADVERMFGTQDGQIPKHRLTAIAKSLVPLMNDLDPKHVYFKRH